MYNKEKNYETLKSNAFMCQTIALCIYIHPLQLPIFGSNGYYHQQTVLHAGMSLTKNLCILQTFFFLYLKIYLTV